MQLQTGQGFEHTAASAGAGPRRTREPDDTLVPLLKAEQVSMATLHERYHPVLELVRVLIGVVPTCDTYLEIWPPAFRTYNIMVPNFLDLPNAIFGVGSAPKADVGLGMYVASRAAECPYCSAHTCSYALRRGAILETVEQALKPGRPFTDRDKAVIAVARSLGRIPCELTDDERMALQAEFDPEAAEWVVFGAVMMGFLNKFMDAIGVELEATTVAETQSMMGEDWSPAKADGELPDALVSTPPPMADSLWTKVRIIPQLPKAKYLDSKWQRGVPNRWPEVGEYLKEITGHDFPVLSRIHTRRVIRAVAAMIRENLTPETTVVGLAPKILAGAIFSAIIRDEALAEDIAAVAAHHDIPSAHVDAARRMATDPTATVAELDTQGRAVLALARAASPSPAEITPEVVAELRAAEVPAAGVVEVVSWLSVLQMLHRLTAFFAA